MLTKLFGTSGIRGHGENFFTDQFSFELGVTFDTFLERHRLKGPVGIGMDPRGSSPRIKGKMTEGLMTRQRTVYDFGITPVPSMCHLFQTENIDGSVMVSGSHIKGELNGIKFFFGGEEISKRDEGEIEQIYFRLVKGRYPARPFSKEEESAVISGEAADDYEEMLLVLAQNDLPKLKIVVDCSNGAQSEIMPGLLTRLGMNVIRQNCSIQEEFITRDTETDNAVFDLQKKVVLTGADLGVAFDADGDRVVFVDNIGRFVPGDFSGALLGKYILGDVLVTPVNTSQVVESLGKRVFRTKIGSPYVIEEMKRRKAAFGFEANGGGIFPEVMFSRDGGATTVKLINLLGSSRKTLSQLYDGLPHFCLSKMKIDFPRSFEKAILEEAKKRYRGEVSELDGVKVKLGVDEWILFRASGNADEFRVMAESSSHSRASELAAGGIDMVKNVALGGKSK